MKTIIDENGEIVEVQDANEIAAIMSGIEGWKRPEGKMRFSIYGVVKGYVREETK